VAYRPLIGMNKCLRQQIIHQKSVTFIAPFSGRSNRQIVEVIFKTVICGREAPVCADSSRKAITAEKNGRLFDYEEACNGSSTSARLFLGEFTSVETSAESSQPNGQGFSIEPICSGS
jgi:hypothetical protein